MEKIIKHGREVFTMDLAKITNEYKEIKGLINELNKKVNAFTVR